MRLLGARAGRDLRPVSEYADGCWWVWTVVTQPMALWGLLWVQGDTRRLRDPAAGGRLVDYVGSLWHNPYLCLEPADPYHWYLAELADAVVDPPAPPG